MGANRGCRCDRACRGWSGGGAVVVRGPWADVDRVVEQAIAELAAEEATS